MADQQSQLEEIESLEAIYGSDFHCVTKTEFFITIRPSDTITCCSTAAAATDHLSSTTTSTTLELQITLPENYPTQSPPIFLIRCTILTDDEIKQLAKDFNELFNRGEVVIYQWIELAREYLDNKITVEESHQIESSKSNGDYTTSLIESTSTEEVEPVPLETSCSDKGTISTPLLIHGEPLTDRKSTFQAHLAQVHSMDEVRLALSKLKENRKISLATHNIVAYRFVDSLRGGGAQIQDCDDDGESAAGGRLLHLLQIMNAQDTLVVVSRWYGGIQLGPDRFKHINNVARTLIQSTATASAVKSEKTHSSGSNKAKGKTSKKKLKI